ncbi:MAG: ATP-binding cassette domain-containing protein [Myxococcota bacterium]
MTAPALEVRIAHRLSPGFALDLDASFDAPTIALFGPSGAGKSSILGAIAGLWTPDTGRIVIDGRVVLDTKRGIDIPPRDRRVGYVPQDSLLFPLRSVRENLVFGQPSDTAPAAPVEALAEALEIEHLLGRRPRMLSGGERQRVALGRAMLSAPALLACDEPFSALDSPRRDRLVRVLLDWRERQGVPLVLVSHQLDEVRAVAEAVAVLDAGAVTEQTTPDALPSPRS